MSTQYDAYINESAAKYGVDPKLIKSIIQQESGFNPKARSPVGAAGLMQLMPGTARGLGVTNVYDPRQNIEGGTKYIRQMLDMFNGDLTKAVAAYNAGPGNVKKYGGVPPFKETQNYVKKVLGNYNGAGIIGEATGGGETASVAGVSFSGVTRVLLIALFFIIAAVFFFLSFPALQSGAKGAAKGAKIAAKVAVTKKP